LNIINKKVMITIMMFILVFSLITFKTSANNSPVLASVEWVMTKINPLSEKVDELEKKVMELENKVEQLKNQK
jgi:outer membrane murein-binding lipoprotein Lpp